MAPGPVTAAVDDPALVAAAPALSPASVTGAVDLAAAAAAVVAAAAGVATSPYFPASIPFWISSGKVSSNAALAFLSPKSVAPNLPIRPFSLPPRSAFVFASAFFTASSMSPASISCPPFKPAALAISSTCVSPGLIFFFTLPIRLRPASPPHIKEFGPALPPQNIVSRDRVMVSRPAIRVKIPVAAVPIRAAITRRGTRPPTIFIKPLMIPLLKFLKLSLISRRCCSILLIGSS